MFPVHLQLPQKDLADQMSAMRTWLDRYNVEPLGFSYREGIGCLVACLEFRVKRQAEAFSAWFLSITGLRLNIGADKLRLVR
jgi:hypothetical protein